VCDHQADSNNGCLTSQLEGLSVRGVYRSGKKKWSSLQGCRLSIPDGLPPPFPPSFLLVLRGARTAIRQRGRLERERRLWGTAFGDRMG
jgi:hypothetical protein